MKTEEKIKKSRADYKEGVFARPEEVVSQETVLEGDIYVKKQKISVIEPHEKFDMYKTDDFSLNHLIAIGATDMLQDMSGKFGEVNLDKIDSFDKNIDE